MSRPRLFSLRDIYAAFQAHRLIPTPPDLPGGIDPTTILQPSGAGASFKVIPAFSEGDPAAYMIADVWINYEEVWAQPWYYLVTAWDDKSPQTNRLKEADGKTSTPPLFDVGPSSGFYTPFWQVFYVVVPPGTDPQKYRSTRQIFDDHLRVIPGATWVYAIRPDAVTFGDTTPVHPVLNKEIGGTGLGTAAWFDGTKVPYLSFGGTNFHIDAQNVVEELPLFHLVRRDASGQPVAFGGFDVAGSVPLGSRRTAEVVAGRPHFGAYWRLYQAIVPATAAAFDADQQADAAAALVAKGLDPKAFQGRVASNGRAVATTDKVCFTQPDFPTSCQWLDSQTRIEDGLGFANILRTSVTETAPLVFYGGKGIGK